jgi:hypothetical protein
LAEQKKKYLFADGFVQKFGDKPAVVEREANGQTVRSCTIKIAGDKLIQLTLWPEFAEVKLGAGYYVACEGAYSASGDNNQFHNISVTNIITAPGAKRIEREVVNQPESSGDGESSSPSQTDEVPF